MALKASALVGDAGGSEDMPLFVVVPKKTSPSEHVSNADLKRDLAAMPLELKRMIQEDQEVVSISRASISLLDSVCRELCVVPCSVKIPQLPEFRSTGTHQNFTWHSSKEDSEDNRKAYMAYVTEVFGGLEDLETIDGNKVLLEAPDWRLRGHADILISSSHGAGTAVYECHLLFELKKDTNESSKLVQAQLELLCADYKSSFPVLAVLTDLNDYWQLIWMENQGNETFMRVSHPLTASLAIGVIQWYLKAVQNMLGQQSRILEPKFYPDGSSGLDGGNRRDDSNSRGKASPNEFKFLIAKLSHRQSNVNSQGSVHDLDMDRDDLYQVAITSFIRQHATELTEVASAVE
ncbi:hypothetical protein CcCBS67573_g10596 [Chytriomyces confervae]|uniref:Uncharacterized protein n=1 Tax=Chytriomyces confervae TaxID=246404 RepID=A0A507CPF8_9FUNG|nr:hypothetical protein CcCBS67573_g10596 [Chytriomyces confervae]